MKNMPLPYTCLHSEWVYIVALINSRIARFGLLKIIQELKISLNRLDVFIWVSAILIHIY